MSRLPFLLLWSSFCTKSAHSITERKFPFFPPFSFPFLRQIFVCVQNLDLAKTSTHTKWEDERELIYYALEISSSFFLTLDRAAENELRIVVAREREWVPSSQSARTPFFLHSQSARARSLERARTCSRYLRCAREGDPTSCTQTILRISLTRRRFCTEKSVL